MFELLVKLYCTFESSYFFISYTVNVNDACVLDFRVRQNNVVINC